jgi:hypothetical protein
MEIDEIIALAKKNTKTPAKFSKIPNGVYIVFWDSGGHSLAAIGRDAVGNCWLAPTNWIDVPSFDHWDEVTRVERIDVDTEDID